MRYEEYAIRYYQMLSDVIRCYQMLSDTYQILSTLPSQMLSEKHGNSLFRVDSRSFFLVKAR